MDQQVEKLWFRGMQTWEYAHEYALRTYAYLMPLLVGGKIGQGGLSLLPLSSKMAVVSVLTPTETSSILVPALLESSSNNMDKTILFFLLRASLALTMASCEVFFFYALCQHAAKEAKYHVVVLTPLVVLWTAGLLGTAAGMNHAAAAFLPSATWIMAYLLGASTLLLQKPRFFGIVAITATLATGWPFGAMILVPLGIRILFVQWKQGSLLPYLFFLSLATILVQAIVMLIDYHYYGKWTSATWNIFRYNAAGSGDSLYGVEPLSYYIKNLLLNLNAVAVWGLFPLIVLYFSQRRDGDILALLAPLPCWIALTFPRPHKEERFLFPLYPILCLGAVLTLDATINAAGRFVAAVSRHKQVTLRQRMVVHALVWLPCMALSLSRTMALAKYYTAPLTMYAHVAAAAANLTVADDDDDDPNPRPLVVCTCGEWYRYPSSFYLPSKVHFGFLPSSFTGQLPQPFSVHGSRSASQSVLQPFNDQNQHEETRYMTDLQTQCDWIVDLLESDDCRPPASATVVATAPFLDAAATSSVHRVLYLPFLHETALKSGKVQYVNYVMYDTRRRPKEGEKWKESTRNAKKEAKSATDKAQNDEL